MTTIKSINAELEHISELQGWFTNDQQLKQWGGAGFTLKVTTAEFHRQLNRVPSDSIALLDGNNELLAFGQYFVRLQRNHFGRLAVAPNHRGKRLSYTLLETLAKCVQTKSTVKGYSLFVLKNNHIARRVYQNCGFSVQPGLTTRPSAEDELDFMVADKLVFPK